MNVLAIDPGTTGGYAFVRQDEGKPQHLVYGKLTPDVVGYLRQLEWDKVVIEAQGAANRVTKGEKILLVHYGWLQGALLDHPVETIGATKWMAAVAPRRPKGKGTRTARKKYLCAKAKELWSLEKVPPHSTSGEGDALCMLYYAVVMTKVAEVGLPTQEQLDNLPKGSKLANIPIEQFEGKETD